MLMTHMTRKGLALRLVMSYLLVPLVPPLALGLSMSHLDPALTLIYFPFGFAAIVVLGTPLLFCFLRLGWTGFFPFMMAGGFCAGITAYLARPSPVGLFAQTGIMSGLVFRIILLGIREEPPLRYE